MDLTDSKAIASLRWMLDMGADETISDSPHNRLNRSHENLSSSAINSRDNRVTDKKKISNTNIEADPDTISHKEKIILANNLVKSLNSFEEILKGIESFKYFNERYENKKVELYEGNSRSPVVVFQEPLSYSEEIDDKLNCNNKNYIKPDDSLSYADNFMHMLDDSIKALVAKVDELLSEISEFSPPIIPASATPFFPSVISKVFSSQCRLTPSKVVKTSFFFAERISIVFDSINDASKACRGCPISSKT